MDPCWAEPFVHKLTILKLIFKHNLNMFEFPVVSGTREMKFLPLATLCVFVKFVLSLQTPAGSRAIRSALFIRHPPLLGLSLKSASLL